MARVTVNRRIFAVSIGGGLALGVILALGAGAGVAQTETPAALAKYAGKYAYAGTREEGMAVVAKAFDEALSGQNAAVRAMAKKTMAQRFIEAIAIETPPGKIGIKLGDLDMVAVEIGKTATIKSPDGKPAKVTRLFDGSKITETLKTDTGGMTNVFQLSADGVTLQRDITVIGARLQKPVKYQLVYSRQ